MIYYNDRIGSVDFLMFVSRGFQLANNNKNVSSFIFIKIKSNE